MGRAPSTSSAADAAVAQYRNRYGFFDLGEQAEVDAALVALGPGAGMNGHRLTTACLNGAADFDRIDLAVSPTRADFGAYWQRNGVADRPNQALNQRWFTHQRSPLAPRNNAGHRAAHIQIDEVAWDMFLYPTCSFR